MAPVSYNFNANKTSYHSRKNDGTVRRVFIFLCLTVVFAGLIYFIFFKQSPETEKAAAAAGPENTAAAPPEKVEEKLISPEKISSPPPITKTQKVEPVKPAPIKEKVVEAAPPTETFPQMETLFKQAETAFNSGNYKQARELCLKLLASRKVPDSNPLWEKAATVLGNANVKIFFSDYPLPGKKATYQVKPNDGLRKIAMDHNTSMEAVQRGNNMKLTDFNVQLGKNMNIYVGDWKIIISKSRRKLYLFDGKDLFKVYNVGIGKQDRTPTGVFVTGGKRKNPDWYSPQGKIPFGKEGNVLGTRWIRLIPQGKCSRQVSGLGIHGTWDPESIGKAKSNGCLRLLNQDVEELFAILPNETKPVPVTIIE